MWYYFGEVKKEMRNVMKDYIKRLTANSKKWELVLWWIVRIILVVGTIEEATGFAGDKTVHEPKILTMLIGHIVLSFGWEIMQLLPETHMFRHLPSYTQDFTSVYIILTAFFGAYVNFYYKVWWWDTTLHFVSGILLVFAGYVFMKAYESRDKIELPIAVVIFAAFCTSFMFGTLWECWEFSFDQLGMSGIPYGDTQHWSLEMAKQLSPEKIEHMFFKPWFDETAIEWERRFALMDTMTDVVANSAGAVIGFVILKLALHKKEKAQKVAKKAAREEKVKLTVK